MEKSNFMWGLQFVVGLAILAIAVRLYLNHLDQQKAAVTAGLANPTDHGWER